MIYIEVKDHFHPAPNLLRLSNQTQAAAMNATAIALMLLGAWLIVSACDSKFKGQAHGNEGSKTRAFERESEQRNFLELDIQRLENQQLAICFGVPSVEPAFFPSVDYSMRANGFSIKMPAIRCPAFKSSERIRVAPLFIAEETISASQNPIRDSSSDSECGDNLRRRRFHAPDRIAAQPPSEPVPSARETGYTRVTFT